MLDSLNPEQRRAVTAGDGPHLVLAGAGSGKTRVLTTRIAYLIHERGVPPYGILAFTFTNKAAREMRERVEGMLGGAAADVWLGTFHATGARILRREAHRLGWERNFAIYDTGDSEAVVKDLLSAHSLPRHVSPSEIRQRISAWKNAEIDARAARDAAADALEEALAHLYAAYDAALRRNNAFDFDDLIARPVELFARDPETHRRYADRFRHVLVDEFQDTNGIQMRFIEQLASTHGNLFVVGDDDQSIYAWRGARIENILEFDRRFPATQVVRLEQNYRSTTPILQAANGVIAHNRGRKGKNLWTARDGGDLVQLHVCLDEEDEASRIVDLVRRTEAAGRSRDAIAVLYRTNAQSRALEDALRRANVPYQIVGGTRFYERREVRDVVAWLKALHNPHDAVALQRIINVPRRGIGSTSVNRLVEAAERTRRSLWQVLQDLPSVELGAAARRRVQAFVDLLAALRRQAETATCQQVVEGVLEATGYFDYLRTSEPATYTARRENVEELVSAAQTFAEESDDPGLGPFLEEISLLSDVDTLDEQVDQVTLMTLHSAKGLEFPVVGIAGLEEGLLPHAISSGTHAEIEEERRLFYVGMTRARDALHLYTAGARRRFGEYASMLPSRFLEEIPAAVLERDELPVARPRRARWAREQPAWRQYDEGDPDAFWRQQGLQDAGASAASAPSAPSSSSSSPVFCEEEESQDPVELRTGMRVRHPRFGEGVIRQLEGTGEMMKVTVQFEANRTRKLVARYARLVPLTR